MATLVSIYKKILYVRMAEKVATSVPDVQRELVSAREATCYGRKNAKNPFWRLNSYVSIFFLIS